MFTSLRQSDNCCIHSNSAGQGAAEVFAWMFKWQQIETDIEKQKTLSLLGNNQPHTHTHTHTHIHTHIGFYGLRGLSIGVMVFILYKLYVLLPYTYPTPKLSPHRRRCISTFPPKNAHCMIYKHFKLWGHWKCPHKSPSPCNTYVHTHVIIQICVLINHINMHTHTHTQKSLWLSTQNEWATVSFTVAIPVHSYMLASVFFFVGPLFCILITFIFCCCFVY